MNLRQRLINKYGVNTPFFIKEIVFDGLSQKYIRVRVPQLAREGKLARFSHGVYYVPTMTAVGQSRIPTKKVSNKKYIYKDGDIIGFYSGLNLDNGLGLSTQMPGTVEVTTNETKRNRQITLGFTTFFLKKPRVRISRENVAILRFLDVIERMENRSIASWEFDILSDFIEKNDLKYMEVMAILKDYPKKTLATLERTGLIDELAR